MTRLAARRGAADQETQGRDERSAHEHPIHEALYRPVLFAGAAPEFVILEVGMIFGLLFLVGVHVGIVILVVLYATVGHALAVWITTHDPEMPAVYLRSLAAKDFYAPHGSPFVTPPAVRPSLPGVH